MANDPITLSINDVPVTVPKGATVLDAARRVNVDIPTMCHLKGLATFTSCMVCLVEESATGKLLPACSHLALAGMQIQTDTDRVHVARRRALELLLSEHVGDCEGPCRCACPVHMDIPGLIRAVAKGAWPRAAAIVAASQPPCVLEDDCRAPCEKVCRRNQIDLPVSIRLLVRCAAQMGAGAQADSPATPFARNVSVIGKLKEEEKAVMMRGIAPGPAIEPANAGAFSASEAMQEAGRCMHCDCRKAHGCSLRVHADTYAADQRHYRGSGRQPFEQITQHADILYEPGKCIRCGICVRIAERDAEPLGLTFIGRGFDIRIGVPFEQSLAEGLQRVAIACAEACPTGALCLRGAEEREGTLS